MPVAIDDRLRGAPITGKPSGVRVEMAGQRFGRLVVESYAGYSGAGKEAAWLCRCDCGGRKVCRRSKLISGKLKSCGCWEAEITRPGRAFSDETRARLSAAALRRYGREPREERGPARSCMHCERMGRRGFAPVEGLTGRWECEDVAACEARIVAVAERR